MFRSRDTTVTASQAKKLRIAAESLGVDMVEDVGLKKNILAFLFSLELKQAIETGESTFADLQVHVIVFLFECNSKLIFFGAGFLQFER